MPEDSPIYDAAPLSVTAPDGTVLLCRAFRPPGNAAALRSYWRLEDPHGATFTGPPYTPDQQNAEVRELIAVWWSNRKPRLL